LKQKEERDIKNALAWDEKPGNRQGYYVKVEYRLERTDIFGVCR
jgi:hypothetical protein